MKIQSNNDLTQRQRDIFILGYQMFDSKTFPFKDETQRRQLWKKHREDLLKAMHQPRTHGNFHEPFGNNLRPHEWWRVEAPEPRGVLNDAVRVDPANPSLFDKEPLLETDHEYLERLKLLSAEDLAYMESGSFKEDERRDLEYREYCKSNP